MANVNFERYERYVFYRDKRGLTDAQVVREAGIARSTISDWKSGRSEPKIDKMIAIANVLHVSAKKLIFG